MKTRSLLTALFLSCVTLPVIGTAADRVGDFSLLDHTGVFHNMSWYDDHVAVALLVQSADSLDAATVAAFDALRTRYDSAKIEFMMINPLGLHDRDAVAASLQAIGISMPVLMDDTRVISESLGIDKLGEMFLFNPSSFMVEYRGPVSDAEQAITALLAGETVSQPEIAMQGTPVTYPMAVAHAQEPLSYSKDIAPILAENCATCHREGGIAPFALDSHTMVQGWSPMIREVLMTKRMPPGQIDPNVGEFINGRTLADADVQKIVHWVESGAVKDGESDPLAQLTWPTTKWALGEPDLVLTVPEQFVPATGVLDYRYVDVPIDLGGKDRWLRGSEYIPGDRTVLHHTVNDLIDPGQTGRQGNPDQASITAYVPGGTPRMDPPNTGGLLMDGSILKLNIHYTTNGRETVDRGEIGLYFYPEGEVPEERMSGRCACIFTPGWTNIPPHDPAFEQRQTITIARDANIHSMLPHMHFRGKSMRFEATYPDGSTEELINIANYNYNWQLSYTYAEPKFVPAGTKITAIGTFDNSAQNPANPDPERSVPWGEQSWDEMFFGAVRWKYTEQGSD